MFWDVANVYDDKYVCVRPCICMYMSLPCVAPYDGMGEASWYLCVCVCFPCGGDGEIQQGVEEKERARKKKRERPDEQSYFVKQRTKELRLNIYVCIYFQGFFHSHLSVIAFGETLEALTIERTACMSAYMCLHSSECACVLCCFICRLFVFDCHIIKI